MISWGLHCLVLKEYGIDVTVYAYHAAYTMYHECNLALAQVQMVHNETHHKPKSCITPPKVCLGSVKMYLVSTSQISDVQKGSQRKKKLAILLCFRSSGNVESGRGLLLCQFRLVIRAKSQQSKN
jgi:hypothetical protein